MWKTIRGRRAHRVRVLPRCADAKFMQRMLRNDICKKGGIKMTILLDLGINMGTHKNGINSLLERLDGLIRFDGVLSCNVIWHEIIYNLGIDLNQKILSAFDIKDLESKIYGIKSIKVCTNDFTNTACLLFEGDMVAKKDDISSDVAADLASAYKNLNSLQKKIGVEMQISIGFAGVKSLKDNSVLSTFISKSELDKVADHIAPIRNAIDSSIRQITK